MALVSPGVEVTIVDESQYAPAPLNSRAFFLIATAQDKPNPNATGVAEGTTAANAGRLYQVTSQRDLISLYGNPKFYSDSNGTPIPGYELNEYGLLAAYSALGVTNTIYTVRADVDLSLLEGSTGRPTAAPPPGTYWLDTTQTTWGINEFDAVLGRFVEKDPIVISDPQFVTGGVPVGSLGVPGDYAVIAIPVYGEPFAQDTRQYFYKNAQSQWVSVGSREWRASWPSVQGTASGPSLTPGDQFTISALSASGTSSAVITVGASGTVFDVDNQINGLNWSSVTSSVVNGRLFIYVNTDLNQSPVTLTQLTGTVLDDLGIPPGQYYSPISLQAPSSGQPLWQEGQSTPRPSGSVWIKLGAAGTGFDPIISEFDSSTGAFESKNVLLESTDWNATVRLDNTGGGEIPAGTVYSQTNFNASSNATGDSPALFYWERIEEGPAVFVGDIQEPTFNFPDLNVGNAQPQLDVVVSLPGTTAQAALSETYTIDIDDGINADQFVDVWQSAAIPFTNIRLTDEREIELTHTSGGIIILDDYLVAKGDLLSDPESQGQSWGIVDQMGMGVNDILKSKPSFQIGRGETLVTTQTATTGLGVDFRSSIRTAGVNYVMAGINNAGTGYAVGDQILIDGAELGGQSGANDLVLIVGSVGTSGEVLAVQIARNPYTGTNTPNTRYATQLSNWVEFEMIANEGAPVSAPSNGTDWYWSVVDQVDIMVNTAQGWQGYRNVAYDENGFPLPGGTPGQTDPNGPIILGSEPTTQSDGTPLVYGDLWVNTSDTEDYPELYRWQFVNGIDQWVLIDTTDQTSGSGIVFADARWALNGDTNPADDPIASIGALLTSNYLDLDAPTPGLYPVGMLLFNLRRSGYNVKEYRANYFNPLDFPDEVLPSQRDAWVTVSGLQSNGAAFMGRKAQRNVVVKQLRAAIDTNTNIRDEDNDFNLIATPGYPELQPNMITLNADRGDTAFIVGDTPFRLTDDATEIQAWATNAAGAAETGEDGLVNRSSYMGLYYPSGLATNLDGQSVVVPASHMMMRTILNSDRIAYPWLAPAGTRRGVIDNALSIGYINPDDGEYVSIRTRQGLRDTLYTNEINPLVFFTANGLLAYGQKTSFASQSALDRINVARLVNFIRRRATIIARPFIFEPNDAFTRNQVEAVFETELIELVAKRGLGDYVVVCDESNNTPARIDRNELWIDIAIEPIKAIEFVYIPIRIFNTGEISGGA